MKKRLHNRKALPYKKFILGTAQIGLNYGVVNNTGKIPYNETDKILQKAKKFKINIIDTAINYGDSEDILGSIGLDGFKVMTKIPSIPKRCKLIEDWAEEKILSSTQKLKVRKLETVFLHNADQLKSESGKRLLNFLYKLKEKKLISKIGVSIYEFNEIKNIADFKPIDIVQIPFNLLNTSILEKINKNYPKRTFKIFARSIFLQGLLLVRSEQLPKKFKRYVNVWNKLREWFEANNVSPLEGCLSFALSNKNIDKIIFGIDSSSHLDKLLNSKYQRLSKLPDMSNDIDNFLIDPRLWKK